MVGRRRIRKNKNQLSLFDRKPRVTAGSLTEIILKPRKEGLRDYQQEALEFVREKRNAIIMLPTGSGKTEIEFQLASQGLEQGRVILVADKTLLCEQHFREAKERFELEEEEVVLAIGSNRDRARNKGAFYSDARLIIGTPETIENDLNNGSLSMNNVSLVIFDEVHHTQGNDSYAKIADKSCAANIQRVGLSASPAESGEMLDRLLENLQLEAIFVKTDKEIKKYVQKPSVIRNIIELEDERYEGMKILKELAERVQNRMIEKARFVGMESLLKGYKRDKIKIPTLEQIVESGELSKVDDYLYQNHRELYNKVTRLLELEEQYQRSFRNADEISKYQRAERSRIEKDMNRMIERARNLKLDSILEIFGEKTFEMPLHRELDVGHQIAQAECISLRGIKPWNQTEKQQAVFDIMKLHTVLYKISNSYEYLSTIGCEEFKEYVKKKVIKDKTKAADFLRNNRSFMRVCTLVDEMEKDHPKNGIILRLLSHDENQSIIFVETHAHAKRLAEFLKENGISSHYLLGGKGMTKKKQQEVREEFEEGKYRVLVATSVAEEGLHLPELKTGIFFSPTKTYLSFEQRKGRVRSGEGRVYILIGEETSDVSRYYATINRKKNINRRIQNLDSELEVGVENIPTQIELL